MVKRSTQPIMVALPAQQKVRPAFTVKRIEGLREHRMNIYDKKDNKIKSKVVQEPGGFLVTFYKGHSIRCRDEAHLRRIGAGTQLVPLINNEGEIEGAIQNIELDTPNEVDELTGEA